MHNAPNALDAFNARYITITITVAVAVAVAIFEFVRFCVLLSLIYYLVLDFVALFLFRRFIALESNKEVTKLHSVDVY